MGIQVPFPYPLRSCPGWPRWERRAGNNYIVFVDESTNRFFELDSHYGYFCHGAVGIPEREYPHVLDRLAPVFDTYRERVGPKETEFKYAEFRRLALDERTAIADQIAEILRDSGAFVSGFYTPTESYILERVRRNLVGESDRIPDDYEPLYQYAAAELRALHAGRDKASLIAHVLHLPVQAILTFLAECHCTFRVLYDPRQKREDRAVAGMVEGFVKSTQDAEQAAVFTGISSNRTSEQEVGLQLADLIVGEVRDFFGANPAFLDVGARRELITPWSDEPVRTVIETPMGTAKTGALVALSAEVSDRLFRPDDNGTSVLSRYIDLFVSGILTGYSSSGTPRDVLIYERSVWDQADLDLLTMLMTSSETHRAGRGQ